MVRILIQVVARARCARGRSETFLLALLLFHPPVLEPYLNLGLVQLKGGSYFHAPGSREVLAEVELLLELCQLPGGEVGPDGALWAQAIIGDFSCKTTHGKSVLGFGHL